MHDSSTPSDVDSLPNTNPGFSLYVHWPFCVRKCPYCDFNSHVVTAVDHARWRWALLRVLDHEAARTPPGHPLSSVFFGGGTPSLMEPTTVAALLDRAAAYWPLAAAVEVTLEANPGTVDRDLFADFRAAGVNRLSLGVQALNDGALRWLGRIHDASQAVAAIDLAQRFFPRVSLDLIYARPGQTPKSWQQELEQAVALAIDHLSLYQLAIEPSTVFFAEQTRGSTWVLPDEDTAATLYQVAQEVTDTAGLPAYEISNYARKEAECRHNLTSWRGGDTIGIGPGAHGRLTDYDGVTMATHQHTQPAIWLAGVESKDYGISLPLSPQERVTELLLMGLRLTAGIARPLFQKLAGCDLEEVLDLKALKYLEGYVILDDTGLRATPKGRLVLNEILRRLPL